MDEIENSVKKPHRLVMSKHDFRLSCIILSERPTLRYKYNESDHIDKNRPETAKSPNSTLTCYEQNYYYEHYQGAIVAVIVAVVAAAVVDC